MPRLKYVEVRVNELLEAIPETRDDDNLLLCHFLKSVDNYMEDEVLARIIEDRIATRFKSVERCRRKLQRENPALRGEAWLRRNTEAAEEFKSYGLE